MRYVPRVLAVAAVAGVATVFAALNGGERVTLRTGLFTLRSVSLAAVVLASVVLGMLLVLAAGFRADLRTRRMLRRYRQALGEDDRPEGPQGEVRAEP